MGVRLLRLGIRLQAISFDHTVRILRHLSFNIFRTPTLFTHALVPSAFRLWGSVMIQESSSTFFPTELGIRNRVPRRTELPYTVDEQKTPFRKRSNGQRRVGAGVLADTGVVCGRLRRLGATHAGGRTRNVSSSRTLQTGSVSPEA